MLAVVNWLYLEKLHLNDILGYIINFYLFFSHTICYFWLMVKALCYKVLSMYYDALLFDFIP